MHTAIATGDAKPFFSGLQERRCVLFATRNREREREDRFMGFVATTPGMINLFGLVESAAAAPIAVLIEGETGTGKELVARAIHRISARSDGAFIAVNCAALP